jgi:uncharacterized membrane protein
MKNKFLNISYALLVLIVLYFFCVMVGMVLPYFPYKYKIAFLATKLDSTIAQTIYLPAFYVHITSSFIALGVGVFQFMPSFIQRHKTLHRRLGMAYVYSILLLACPSGFILAINANGGFAAKTGFVLQCIVWFVLTFLAVQKAVQKQWLAHIQYIILSYAVTLAAFSLRTESYWIKRILQTQMNETYIAVTWLSWVGNLLIGLLIIELGIANRLFTKVFQQNKLS